jgi:hypothetical protein
MDNLVMIPSANRSVLKVIHNTLPESCMGQWLSEAYIMHFRIKPAFDNSIIMIEVAPLFLVVDASSRKERFRFQTSTTFSFSGAHSRNYIDGLILHLANLNIDEFNEALQQTKSLLVINRKFEKMTMEEIKPRIEDAFKVNYWKTAGVNPHWRSSAKKSEVENNQIIATLPAIPYFKQFKEQFTQEQDTLTRCLNEKSPGETDLQILKDSIAFNKQCFGKLKEIDLTSLTDTQYYKLRDYLRYIYSAFPTIFNDLSADFLFRVTVITDRFLQDGKVRESKYLTYPPLKDVQERGVFNRASSPSRTIFYATERENVAVREIKPKVGSKIILSTWMNHSGKPLNSFPICLTAGINNKMADSASYAFEMMADKMHPLVVDWMAGVFEFLGSEFIKESQPTNPKRYDYLFSAMFADGVLSEFPEGSKIKNYDAIAYPSVAWGHIPNNVAILPAVVDSRFTLIEAKEFQVMETWYDKDINLDQFPAKLELIRTAIGFTNGNITWSDD